MKIRLLAAALALCSLAACDAPANPDPTGSGADETATVHGSATALTSAPHRIAITGSTGATGSAVVDPVKGDFTVRLESPDPGTPIAAEAIKSGADRFVRLAGGSLPALEERPWIKLKGDDLTEIGIPDDKDPAGLGLLIASVATAQRDQGGGYRGTIDLNTAAPGLPLADQDVITALGDAADTAPFTARIDGANRIETITVSIGEATLTYTVSDYEAAVAVTPPATFTEGE